MSKVKTVFQKELKLLGEAFKKFPWQDSEAYSLWLAQTHYYVNHSTRLLMLAGSRVAAYDQKTHWRFIEHTKEEKGHENMTLNDLKVLNKDVKTLPELSSTSSFYQSQYYWIEHVHPMAFFGYILMLEGLAADYADFAFEKVTESHGPKACSFLKVHSGEDPDHVEKALALVENAPAEVQDIIVKNFLQAKDLYIQMLQDCSTAKKNYKLSA